MSTVSELRVDMVDFIKTRMRSDTPFTTKDICEACNLSFDQRIDVQRVYAVILKWRNISQSMFAELDTDALLKEHGTVELVWDAFLNRLNKKNVFLLFSIRDEDGRPMYYQPSWVDKEMLDFMRMRKQLHGQITILWEMDRYGEEFPESEGILMSPKEMANEIMETLERAQLKISRTIEAKLIEGDDDN